MNDYYNHEYESVSSYRLTTFDGKPIYKGVPPCWRKEDHQINRARILDDAQIERVLAFIDATSNARASDEVKFLLSFYAGLRAAEIAGMTLDAVVDAEDRISRHIIVGRQVAKGGRQRLVPMHPRIRDALIRFRTEHPETRFLAFSNRGGLRRQNANAVKAWFLHLYRQVGLHGCSSHSGRRTFITRLARLANLHGTSLRDVQLLAGHARMETTAAYIEPADDLSRLVAAFGAPSTPNLTILNSKGEHA